MAIPENIRKVPRPVNTVVVDNGKDGPNRYAVRERVGIKYIQNGNPQPRNEKVIGHIFEGAYVPINGNTALSGPDMLSYGAAAFAKSVSSDILADLVDVYPIKDACAIMAIATLRIIHPTITAEGNHLETMESTEKETVGIAETRHRKRPCESDSILWRPLSMDSYENVCGQGNLKRKAVTGRTCQLL